MPASRVPSSKTIHLLMPLWLRIFQRTEIGVDSDFFELGGTPSAACQLFAAIESATGRELSPLTIYQAPTISTLATILEQPDLPRLQSLVQLRRGITGLPVFFLHGLGGSVAEFFQVAKHMGSPRPLWGLQTKGIDGLDEPLNRIEDMAEFYLQAMRKSQPHGPYALVGYSLGGLVALEIARNLLRTGEAPEWLVMVDSYPESRYISTGQRARVISRRVKRYVLRRRKGQHQRGPDRAGSLEKPTFGPRFTKVMEFVKSRANEALAQYKPASYTGKVKFVKAAVSTEFPDDPVEVWSKLIRHLEVEVVPGDHLGILGQESEALADVLSNYLKGDVVKP